MPDAALLQRRLARFMQERGLKNTRQREVILETFLEVEDHVGLDVLLERVQARLPGVGYATIYRSMKLFVEAGVAHERRFGDGQARYEPVRVGQHHDHLICVVCGHIFEFEDPIIEQQQIEVMERYKMRMVSHHLDLFGECLQGPNCSYRAAMEAQGEARER